MNRRNGGAGSAYPNYISSKYGNQPSVSRYGVQVFTMLFAGVQYVHVENIFFYDVCADAMQQANVQHSTAINLGKRRNPADTNYDNDGIWVCNGGCTDCRAYDLWGEVSDDPWAFNAFDTQAIVAVDPAFS